jgi:hypothetical protein
MLIEMFGRAGILAKVGMLIAVATVGMALAYAVKPTERRLALMRPLSLAALFGGLSTFTVGAAIVLRVIEATATFDTGTWRRIAAGAAESAMGLFFAFGCLTVAWLLVALGLRRAS